MRLKSLFTIFFVVILIGCDSGLGPTDEVPAEGSLIVNISYTGDWPPADELFEFRFVAFEFLPTSLTDFLRINEMLISDQLEYFVDSETIIFQDIENREYFYSAIAWQFGENVFADWTAAGIYTENDGYFKIEGNIIEIDLEVDFDNLPDFPPPLPE